MTALVVVVIGAIAWTVLSMLVAVVVGKTLGRAS